MSLIKPLADLVLTCQMLVSKTYEWVPIDGFKHLYSFEEEMGKILFQDKTVFITYRGTETIPDAIADANVARKSFRVGSIHKGAYSKFLKVSPLIVNQVLDIKEQYNTIVITGHSLGAMLATIASDFIRAAVAEDVRIIVIVFAPPRLGNSEYRDYYQSLDIESYGFASDNDLVPKVPLTLKQVVNVLYMNFQGVLAIDKLGNHSIDAFEPVLKRYFHVK